MRWKQILSATSKNEEAKSISKKEGTHDRKVGEKDTRLTET